MTKYSKIALAALSTALCAQAGSAAPPNSKLWNGSWHLNAAGSKWSAAGHETKETRNYDYSAGILTMKSSSTDAAGKQMDFTYSAACDGKFSPMTGNPRADSISLGCVSGREINATSRLHGKVTVKSVGMVSADGKHLTLKRTYVLMKGAPTETLEFTR